MNAANKLRLGYELSYDDMLDIVLHNDKSFIEYVNGVNNNVYTLLFKDELGTWHSLSYQYDKQKYFPGFVFKGQPKRFERQGMIAWVGKKKVNKL